MTPDQAADLAARAKACAFCGQSLKVAGPPDNARVEQERIKNPCPAAGYILQCDGGTDDDIGLWLWNDRPAEDALRTEVERLKRSAAIGIKHEQARAWED